MAFHETHGLDTVIARCCNNYGPFQFPEKLIPLMILNALAGRPLPVYGDGLQVREWIHVDDHCAAIDAILAKGGTGEIYNVGMGDGRRNLDVIRAIVRLTGRDDSLIHHIPDRPGHDRRYALRTDKIRAALGWCPRRAFDDGLAATVDWYRANRAWTARVRQGADRRDDAARASAGARS
jgi:dTDP-glucose 4,6-dehydratase